MPYATNPVDGVRIYYELIGEGPPLMMYYGALRSTVDWYELGFVDALKADYQLILIDPRSHGRSDGPHDAGSYTSQLHAGDAIAVLDELRIDKTHCLGYSMGGRICLGLLKHMPERLKTMIIGGQHTQSLDALADEIIASVSNGMESLLNMLENKRGVQKSGDARARFLTQDPDAIAAMAMGIKNEKNLGDDLDGVTIPCLFYAGTEDPWFELVQSTAARVPGAEFHALPDLNHVEGAVRVDLVQPIVSDFLSRHED